MFVIVGGLSLRAVSIAGVLKEEIGFKKGTMSLYYIIQNQMMSKDPYPLVLSSDKAVELYNQCIIHIRLCFGAIAICIVPLALFGA